uniref:Uncharacterized protein n=1 Tax=Panagrolaimus sp. ES5 TaxID=591445 RepID=A0AC34F4N0_9BILA
MFRQLITLFIFFLIIDSKSVTKPPAFQDFLLKSNENHTMESSYDLSTAMQSLDGIYLSSTNLMPTSRMPSPSSQKSLSEGSTTTMNSATESALLASSSPPSTSSSSSLSTPILLTTTISSIEMTSSAPVLTDIKGICLYAYESCFSQWSAEIYNESSIASFCDYSFYKGNACMKEKTNNISFTPRNASKPFYPLLECTRMLSNNSNSDIQPLKQLSWNFLSYCIANSPTNTSNPECFKHVEQNCSNPLSSKCTSVCINYIFDEADYSYDSETTDSSSSRIMLSIWVLLITFLF